MTTADVRSSAFTVDITATTEIDAPPERMVTTATPAAFVAMNDALATRVQDAGHRA